MSEATKDINDTTDLDARVAALKADGGTAAPSRAQTAPGADPNAQVDFDVLANQAVEEMVTSPPPPTDAALEEAVAQLASESPVPAVDQDLAKAVEKLIQEAPVAIVQTAEPSEPPKKIEALDAQIANLADDLIAGEFADEQDILQGQVGEPPVKEAPPPPPTVASDKPAAAPSAEPEPVPVAPLVSVIEAPSRSQAAPAPPPAPKPPAAARKVADSAAKVAKRHGAKAADRLKPLGNKVLGLLSLPLRNKPKYTRDLVGWLAIWTLFMSVCLWTYVLFFRSAKPPTPVTHVVAAEPEHAEAKSSGHGESKSGHGDKKDAKPDKAKKPPAKKEPAKKDSAKSHGGGH